MAEYNLTPEQQELLPVFYDKWLKIALSTEPSDHLKAEDAILSAYQGKSLDPPRVIFWADSTRAGACLAALLARPKNAIDDPPAEMVRDMVVVGSDNPEPTDEEINRQREWGELGYGQQDAHWLGYHDFVRDQGLEPRGDEIDGLIELAKNACWYWTFKYAAIIVEKPTIISIDDQGRPHNSTGPAIAFRDGYKKYAWHGIELSERIIETPELLTGDEIMNETNSEIRRAMIECLGFERFFEKVNAKVLDEDVDQLGMPRRLLTIDLQDDEPVTVIQMTNSTAEPDGHHKQYFIRVHPELRPLLDVDTGAMGDAQPLTCQNALASTHGMVGAEYILAVET